MGEAYSDIQKKISKECMFTALIRLLKTKEFNEITITQITKLAGVSRMAFYRNYQKKEDIIASYANDIFDELLKTFKSKTLHDMRIGIAFYFSFFKEKHQVISILIKSGQTDIFYEAFYGAVAETFKTKPSKANENPVYIDYLARYATSGLFRVLIEWINKGMIESVDEMAEFIYKMAKF